MPGVRWFGALCWTLAGCGPAEDNAALVILGNVSADASCTYSTEPEATMLSVGYVDVAFGRRFTAHLLVENTGTDPVEVLGGWRNVWAEPDHNEVVSGRGEKARRGLVPTPVVIAGGERQIVGVDVLGDGWISYRREFEELVAAGRAPPDLQASVVIVLEGDADGTNIASSEWIYGVGVGLGRLVETPAGTDSPLVGGLDCCVAVASPDPCETGQNDHFGSCSECAGCWPEVCNFGQNPSCGGQPLGGCVVP